MAQFTCSCVIALTVLIPLASALQFLYRPSTSRADLRFVTQLSVSGCPVFVHDTGAPDGPHLAIEPLMCVNESLHGALPRYDPITQQSYVSIAVMLTDEAMLAEAKHQLQHFSFKSVVFATRNITEIRASTAALSPIQALGFDWAPGEATGILRLGCTLHAVGGNEMDRNCSVTNFLSSLENREANIFTFLGLTLTAQFQRSGLRAEYQLVMRAQRFFDQDTAYARYAFGSCYRLQFVQSIRSKNCTAQVHRRSARYFIEPLMCHDSTTMTSKSVMYDHSRDMHYLKLDIVLQDEEVLNAVITQLKISRPSISFLRVRRAHIEVADALRRQIEFSGLIVSGDWRSGQVRAYCKSEGDCKSLREEVQANSFRFLRHVKWSLTLLAEESCTLESTFPKYLFGAPVNISNDYRPSSTWMDSCRTIRFANPKRNLCSFTKLPDGRKFVAIQQRMSGSVSFQREWSEYVSGFGDETNFWIGLDTIGILSSSGVTLRVEMKLWNGTDLHAEYSGFKVGNMSTEFRMTYQAMMLGKLSSVTADSMLDQNDSAFVATLHLGRNISDFGEAGWWFSELRQNHFNPNGLYPQSGFPIPKTSIGSITWDGVHLRQIRLMLQI